jgi:hypothetical protein
MGLAGGDGHSETLGRKAQIVNFLLRRHRIRFISGGLIGDSQVHCRIVDSANLAEYNFLEAAEALRRGSGISKAAH